MKKYFLLIVLAAVTLSSCRKTIDSSVTDPTTQALLDDKAIQDYFLSNGITGTTKTSEGLYYQITDPGTGTHPTTASNITVGYTTYLTDGTQVESRASYYFSPLNDLIEAWKIGIPLIGKGGSITIYSPSGLAYGSTGSPSGTIAANTVLIFKITLQGFTN